MVVKGRKGRTDSAKPESSYFLMCVYDCGSGLRPVGAFYREYEHSLWGTVFYDRDKTMGKLYGAVSGYREGGLSA